MIEGRGMDMFYQQIWDTFSNYGPTSKPQDLCPSYPLSLDQATNHQEWLGYVFANLASCLPSLLAFVTFLTVKFPLLLFLAYFLPHPNYLSMCSLLQCLYRVWYNESKEILYLVIPMTKYIFLRYIWPSLTVSENTAQS